MICFLFILHSKTYKDKFYDCPSDWPWRIFLDVRLVWAVLLTGFSLLSHFAALILPLTLWLDFPAPQLCYLRIALCACIPALHWTCMSEPQWVGMVTQAAEWPHRHLHPSLQRHGVRVVNIHTHIHARTHTLQRISITFRLALSQSSPVIYCISCGLSAEMVHYVGCASVYVYLCECVCSCVFVRTNVTDYTVATCMC